MVNYLPLPKGNKCLAHYFILVLVDLLQRLGTNFKTFATLQSREEEFPSLQRCLGGRTYPRALRCRLAAIGPGRVGSEVGAGAASDLRLTAAAQRCRNGRQPARPASEQTSAPCPTTATGRSTTSPATCTASRRAARRRRAAAVQSPCPSDAEGEEGEEEAARGEVGATSRQVEATSGRAEATSGRVEVRVDSGWVEVEEVTSG